MSYQARSPNYILFRRFLGVGNYLTSADNQEKSVSGVCVGESSRLPACFIPCPFLQAPLRRVHSFVKEWTF